MLMFLKHKSLVSLGIKCLRMSFQWSSKATNAPWLDGRTSSSPPNEAAAAADMQFTPQLEVK